MKGGIFARSTRVDQARKTSLTPITFKGMLPNFDPLDGNSIVQTIDFLTNF